MSKLKERGIGVVEVLLLIVVVLLLIGPLFFSLGYDYRGRLAVPVEKRSCEQGEAYASPPTLSVG